MYYISRAADDDNDFVNDDNFVDYNFVDYDGDYHDDFSVNDDGLVYYTKALNCFERLGFVKNNIKNLINNNNNYNHNIGFLVNNINIFIYENVY